MLVCEMAASLKKDGKTILDALEELYETHGFYLAHVQSIELTGADAMQKAAGLMTELRESAPAFIGVDGGGGKTEFVLFTSAGEVLGRELLSATNPNSVGIDRTCSVLKEGIDKLLPLARNGVKGIHLGIAGIPQGVRREYIARYLSAAYPQISSRVSGDVDNVLASCDGVECGVFATVGSGSCVFVKTESETRGFGGGGYLLDEGGSGFDLGREAMRAVLYAEQGLGEKTLLSDLVNEKLGARLLLCITELYAGAPRSISSLAPLVFSAVRAGDAVAERIVKKSFEALLKLLIG
jgi:N-acetylglucosamine kinase-like BadF-type ATPase